MTAAELFTLVNLTVLPGWILLAFLPAWKWTRVLAAYAIPGLLSALYLVVMVSDVDMTTGGFGSIEQVGRLFQNEWLLLAGWVHYLAFDLFIGAWEVRDAQRLEVPHKGVDHAHECLIAFQNLDDQVPELVVID